MSFSQAPKFIKQLKGKGNKPPAIGKLLVYLLIADMCATELVAQPSVEEMATMVYMLKAGATKGLAVLGYLLCQVEIATQLKEKDIIQAFTQFYSDISSGLTAGKHHDLNWNPVTAEHSLCKIYRTDRKGFYY